MSETDYAPSLPLGDLAVKRPSDVQHSNTTIAEHRDEELRVRRTINSMLWAAYGDALGFISELAGQRLLRHRTDGAALDRLMSWERRVGGRSGVDVRLPLGCWSDDTQLRLAVSRSINDRGFDTETFANVELPVWPSYALGGGRASKAAARNLANPRVPWYANTVDGWTEAGGNGAAMRIQPHVWASAQLSDRAYLIPTIEDTICTHGHPRALVGACFHAELLAYCIAFGDAPSLYTAQDLATELEETTAAIEDHELIGTFWIGEWERVTDASFGKSWGSAVHELVDAIGAARDAIDRASTPDNAYEEVCRNLGLREKHQVGSGILTTVAAGALATITDDAYRASVLAANALGTDTDTIASMAGALLGACDSMNAPPQLPLDAHYLAAEATRLCAVAVGKLQTDYPYPDLLRWTAPTTQADALVQDEEGLAVEGFGPVSEVNDEIYWSPRHDFLWRWVRTCFDQTLLIKSRPIPAKQAISNRISVRGSAVQDVSDAPKTSDTHQKTSFEILNPGAAPAQESGVLSPESSDVSRPSSLTETPLRPDRARRQSRSRPPSQPPIRKSTGMPPEQLEKYAEHARRKINDDSALVAMLRQVAQVGNQADLAYVATNLYDDLRG